MKTVCHDGLHLYRLLPSKLVNGRILLSSCIGSYHVPKHGLNTGALVVRASRARDYRNWRSVKIYYFGSIGSGGWIFLGVTGVRGFREASWGGCIVWWG